MMIATGRTRHQHHGHASLACSTCVCAHPRKEAVRLCSYLIAVRASHCDVPDCGAGGARRVVVRMAVCDSRRVSMCASSLNDGPVCVVGTEQASKLQAQASASPVGL